MRFAQPQASLVDYLWRYLERLPAKHESHGPEETESDADHVVEGLLHLVRSGVAI